MAQRIERSASIDCGGTGLSGAVRSSSSFMVRLRRPEPPAGAMTSGSLVFACEELHVLPDRPLVPGIPEAGGRMVGDDQLRVPVAIDGAAHAAERAPGADQELGGELAQA